MIQYKHYNHITGGYKDAYSANATPDDVEIFASLSAFAHANGSCFTYLPLEDKSYFLQVTDKGEIFSHGLADSVSVLGNAYAAEYIGQLEERSRRVGDDEGDLPEGRLPNRRAEWGLQLGRQLKPVFAKVADTLLYTDKPVVLVGQNVDELIRYVKVCLALFPVQFANTIGFSVCPESLPSYFGDKTSPIGKNIRLVATDFELDEDDAWEVINVARYQTANESLRPYGAAVDRVSEYLVGGSGNRVKGLVDSVCPCFSPDGKVDSKRLENALAVYAFNSEMNGQTALALLKAKANDSYGDIRQTTVLDAVNELFKKDSLTSEEERLIEGVRKDENVNEYVKEGCGRYAFKKLGMGESLTPMQEEDILSFLSGLSEEELSADGEALRSIFAMRRNVSALNLFCKAYQSTRREEFSKLITAYVHIDDTYNYAQQTKEDFDTQILQVAEKYPDCKTELVGAMIFSCYMPHILASRNEKAKTERRLKALYQSMKGMKGTQKVEYILKLKRAVEICADMAFLEICGADDFNLLNEDDLTALVRGLSFEECLALANDPSVKIDGYVMLQDGILSRLYSLKEVKDNIGLSKNLGEYKKFMKLYPAQFPDTAEIADYVSVLTKSDDLGNEIADYRLKFVLDSYKNMSFASKSKIARKASESKQYEVRKPTGTENGKDDILAILESENASFLEKQRITEAIIDEMRANNDRAKRLDSRNVRSLAYSYLFGLLFGLIALAALFAVPVTTAILLGTDVATRVVEFFKYYHILAVLAVILLNIISYLIFWATSRHDRVGSLKKSIVVTLLYGLLPVVVYAATYAVTYFFL